MTPEFYQRKEWFTNWIKVKEREKKHKKEEPDIKIFRFEQRKEGKKIRKKDRKRRKSKK